MAEVIKKGKIKRRNGANTEVLLPYTTQDQVEGLGSAIASIQADISTKITNPTTKTAGNFLKYDGSTWIAANVPDTGVLSVAGTDGIKVTGTANVTVGVDSSYKLPTVTEFNAKAEASTVSALASVVSGHATAIGSLQTTVSSHTSEIASLQTGKQDKFEDGAAKIAEVASGVVTLFSVSQSGGKIADGASKAAVYTTAQVDANISSAVASEAATRASADASLSVRIDALEQRGRYLSGWSAKTGKPTTYPVAPTTEYTYNYKSGDYYIVTEVNTANNLRPAGTGISTTDKGATWTVPTAAETDTGVAVGDTYTYDGTNWVLSHSANNNQTIETNTVSFGPNAKVKILAGSNIQVVGSASNETITISASDTTYSAGTGLSLSGTTFNHSNSVTAVTSDKFLKLKYDAQGHITGSASVVAADITGLISDTSSLTKYVKKAGDTMTGDLNITDAALNFKYAEGTVDAGSINYDPTDSILDLYSNNNFSITTGSLGSVIINSGSESAAKTTIDGTNIPKNATLATADDIAPLVTGPSSSTDNAIARFDGTTGKIIQNSAVTINDSGSINIGTGTTNLVLGGNKISSGGSVNIEGASGFIVKAAGSENNISIDDTNGIKFISKAGSNYGYTQLPVNDSSTSSNYHTIATREWVEAKNYLTSTGVTAGTYSAVQVNSNGLVTAGGQMLNVIEAGATDPGVVDGGWYFECNA